jgi:hypothetical protein
MTVTNPASCGGRRPEVAQGFTIAAIATDFKIPRQTLILPAATG